MSRLFDPSSDPEMPARLAEALRELHPVPAIPESVDSAVLNAARAHLAGQTNVRGSTRFVRDRRLLRWAGAGAAAAAAIAAAILVVIRPHTPATVPVPTLAGDVNGDGRVDILDAYSVARALADKSRTTKLPSTWDVNHDGAVDQKDVDWIANAAVAVKDAPAGQGSSKLARSGGVFDVAADLQSLEQGRHPSRVAIATTPDGARRTTKGAVER